MVMMVLSLNFILFLKYFIYYYFMCTDILTACMYVCVLPHVWLLFIEARSHWMYLEKELKKAVSQHVDVGDQHSALNR